MTSPTCQAFRFAPSCALIATKRTPRGVLVCPACAAWMDNILTRAGVAERCTPIALDDVVWPLTEWWLTYMGDKVNGPYATEAAARAEFERLNARYPKSADCRDVLACQIEPGAPIAPTVAPEYHPASDRRATARFSGSDDDWPDTMPMR